MQLRQAHADGRLVPAPKQGPLASAFCILPPLPLSPPPPHSPFPHEEVFLTRHIPAHISQGLEKAQHLGNAKLLSSGVLLGQ